MSEPDLVRALRPVIAALDGLGVAYYVTGSLASSAHGVPRASIDCDIVADLQVQQAGALCEDLSGAYYVPTQRVGRAIADRSSFNVIHLATMIKVDVFVATARPFDRRALGRASMTLFDAATQLRVRTASAEDTVLAKLEWFRKGGEVSERQWTDVTGILRTLAGTLDTGYLASGARELGVADLLGRALQESA